MSLINPSTGMPFEQKNTESEKLIQALRTLSRRIDVMGAKSITFDCAFEAIFEVLEGKLGVPKQTIGARIEKLYEQTIEEIKAQSEQQAVNINLKED